MQTVAITGGCGFVGRHLTNRLLADGINVRLFDTFFPDNKAFPAGFDGVKGYTFTRFDINDIDLLEQNLEDVDAIVHLAGISARYACLGNPYGAFMSNILTSSSLMEAARRSGVKNIVFASSIRVSNTDVISEKDPYTISKYIAELWFQTTSKITDVIVNIVRFANIYGPGQGEGTAVQDFIARALKGEYPVKFEGEVRIPFLYIDDAVDVICHILQNSKISNICEAQGMEGVSLYEVAKIIVEEALKSGVSFEEKELAKAKKYSMKSNIPERKPLPPGFCEWVPRVDIKEGVIKTMRHIIEARR